MLLIASERLDTQITNIDVMIEDLMGEFGKVKPENVIESIKLGSLGKYGVNYKLTTQLVAYWIRCFTEPKIDKL